jgi:N-acetylneuraminic acid mutarotase
MMNEPELTLPTSRLCHIAVTWGGCMWIHGGHNTHAESQTFNEIKSDLWKYKFEEKKWEQVHIEKGTMPAKTEHSAVIYQNKMYLFGGYSGEYFTNTLFSYDFGKFFFGVTTVI